jgi:molybdopterin-containing oxidoreductase family iron-sulfur binding subunit
VPESHFLECWGDARAEDGRASIQQPLIEPLNPSRSAWELLAALAGRVASEGYDIIRQSWLRRHGQDGFERYWSRCLHDGIEPTPPPGEAQQAASLTSIATNELGLGEKGLGLIIRPDPHVLDGRQAENAWLQELPKPFTKLTWENAIHLSPATARELKIEHGDRVEMQYRERRLEGPVWILPGHADGCATIHLGYGRRHGSAIARRLGFNAYALQTSDSPWGGTGLTIRKIGTSHAFSTTQDHRRMEGREPVREAESGKPMPALAEEAPAPEETLFPPVHYDRPAWGMVINLNSCIGCSACTVACQAENNIPVVGREQVLRAREMHWIRVDVYNTGSDEKAEYAHQPVPCMHCENAPCEVVCPVAATVHDHEGLNLMVYNRCIGTRYCSNNCPYKVRRFNFLAYTGNTPERLALMRNPEVSVRMRGVMEKCTYCVQRISAARIAASKEARPIRDGEVIPACAQACPADAIVFGDLLDPESRISALRKSPYHYALLAELNTRPRTTYLARVRNRNPEAAGT